MDSTCFELLPLVGDQYLIGYRNLLPSTTSSTNIRGGRLQLHRRTIGLNRRQLPDTPRMTANMLPKPDLRDLINCEGPPNARVTPPETPTYRCTIFA